VARSSCRRFMRMSVFLSHLGGGVSDNGVKTALSSINGVRYHYKFRKGLSGTELAFGSGLGSCVQRNEHSFESDQPIAGIYKLLDDVPIERPIDPEA
jgi:hypothetical protein